MEKINLEEILTDELAKNISGNLDFMDSILIAMKEACRQTLELAAENAKLGNTENGTYSVLEVSKQSILDVINLIE
jgi:hypothetical protein